MANPIEPYVVTFRNAELPTKPDHSSSLSGGPTGSGRAGHTSVTLKKHLELDWDQIGHRPDGSVAIFCKEIRVEFALDPITIQVSSDYPPNSCPYKVTWTHELEDHAKSLVRIFLAYREAFIGKLNEVKFPTRQAPQWVLPKNIDGKKGALEEHLFNTIKNSAAELVGQMDADRDAKDSPAAYDAIYRKCSAADWQMHGN